MSKKYTAYIEHDHGYSEIEIDAKSPEGAYEIVKSMESRDLNFIEHFEVDQNERTFIRITDNDTDDEFEFNSNDASNNAHEIIPDQGGAIMTDKYSHLQMEAALCLWEAVLENRNDLEEVFAPVGTVEMRHKCIYLADACLSVWDALSEEMQEHYAPYDWEFYPALLPYIDWNTTSFDRDPVEVAKELTARADAAKTKTLREADQG